MLLHPDDDNLFDDLDDVLTSLAWKMLTMTMMMMMMMMMMMIT